MTSTVSATLLSLLLAVPSAPAGLLQASEVSPVPTAVSRADWQPEPGDRLVVDTAANEGYIIHSDGRYLRLDVVTGQKRYVSYIGRYYFAKTPDWDWEAQSLDVKGDRVTFGDTGRFLRLYKDGDERTAYGIHGHRDEDIMFAAPADERFRSMGCIIVTDNDLDLLLETWELNGQVLSVITRNGIEDLNQAIIAIQETDAENL